MLLHEEAKGDEYIYSFIFFTLERDSGIERLQIDNIR